MFLSYNFWLYPSKERLIWSFAVTLGRPLIARGSSNCDVNSFLLTGNLWGCRERVPWHVGVARLTSWVSFEFKCLVHLWFERLIEAKAIVGRAVISLLLFRNDPSAIALVSEVLLLRRFEIIVDSFLLFESNVASFQLVYHLESLGFVLSSSVIISYRFEFFVGFRCVWTLHCAKHKVALFQIWRLCRRSANFSLCIDSSWVKRLCALHPLEVFVWIAESELSLLHSLFELLSVFIHVIRQLMNHQSALILRLVHSFESSKSEVSLFQVSRWLDRGAFARKLLWGWDITRLLLA